MVRQLHWLGSSERGNQGNRYRIPVLPLTEPTAKNIKENNPSQWKKIVEAVDDFVQNPKNKTKLKDVTEAAVQNFPNNTRDFSTTLKALGG